MQAPSMDFKQSQQQSKQEHKQTRDQQEQEQYKQQKALHSGPIYARHEWKLQEHLQKTWD